MKKRAVSLMVCLGLALGAQAAGDPKAGKGKVAVCAACHGSDGNSALALYPKLAGQRESYLLKQLHDIKGKKRVILEMTGMLDNLNDQDLQDIAAYFSSQTPKPAAAKKMGATEEQTTELLALGERVYRAGDETAHIPACMACHSPTGAGVKLAKYPALAGQHFDYTVKQLYAFQEEKRTNDGDAKIMRSVAKRLTKKEIEAVSNYIQGLRADIPAADQ
jgi:cytochrome c553